jgi:hypothetical protein
MEFDLAWYLNGYQVNDNMFFGEVYYLHEKLGEKLKEDKGDSDNILNQIRNLARK